MNRTAQKADAVNSAGSSRAQRRRLEWCLLSTALLVLVAGLCTTTSLDRINYLVQDAGLRLLSRPAHPDIAIVAIDDRSIAAIGRWPWRRALHAELISRVSAQQPRAIAMDVARCAFRCGLGTPRSVGEIHAGAARVYTISRKSFAGSSR